MDLHAISTSGQRTILGPAGPWGRFEYSRIEIAMPEASLAAEAGRPPRWFFSGRAREEVIQLLETAGLSTTERVPFVNGSRWQVAPDGIWVDPPVNAVLAMGPGPRQSIYNILAMSPENAAQREPLLIPSRTLDEHLALSGLDPGTTAMIRRLLYPRGSWLAFADYQTMLPSLTSESERRRLAATISRSETFLMRLMVDETSDIDAIIGYWDTLGRARELRPLLESLARVPGGSGINVSYLLPRFARQRIYTYPRRSDALESRADCFWTALNFFKEQPGVAINDAQYTLKTLSAEYQPTSMPPKLGDLLVLLDEEHGSLVHAAVHVADDVVFTKNGSSSNRPWIFMKVDAMVDFYTAIKGPLRQINLRRVSEMPVAQTNGSIGGLR